MASHSDLVDALLLECGDVPKDLRSFPLQKQIAALRNGKNSKHLMSKYSSQYFFQA